VRGVYRLKVRVLEKGERERNKSREKESWGDGRNMESDREGYGSKETRSKETIR